MKIETKFDMGERVFYINSYNELQIGFINKILFIQYNMHYGLYYGLSGNKYAYREQELFTIREEAEAKLKEIQDEV